MEERNEELERIEQALLEEEESEKLDKLLEDFLEEPMPAFEDPDKTEIPIEPVEICNYSNGYGNEPQLSEEEAAALKKKKKDDKTIMGLMITAAALSVGIIGVLVYWLIKLL